MQILLYHNKAKESPLCEATKRGFSSLGGCLVLNAITVLTFASISGLPDNRPTASPSPSVTAEGMGSNNIANSPIAAPNASSKPSAAEPPIFQSSPQQASDTLPPATNTTSSQSLVEAPQTNPPDAPQLASPTSSPLSFDPAQLRKANALYQELKRKYPDPPKNNDHSLQPHTIDIAFNSVNGGVGALNMSMPRNVWNKLDQEKRNLLVLLLQSKIQSARKHPETFVPISPEAPAYLSEIEFVRAIRDDGWFITVGHLDSDNYLVEEETVLKGLDDSAAPEPARPVFTYANAEEDAVFNSRWDGSVQQVTKYLNKHLNDPDSIKYSHWTDVLKTGTGYQVSVTYRAKNGFGAYVLEDETYTFDQKGRIVKIIDNQ